MHSVNALHTPPPPSSPTFLTLFSSRLSQRAWTHRSAPPDVGILYRYRAVGVRAWRTGSMNYRVDCTAIQQQKGTFRVYVTTANKFRLTLYLWVWLALHTLKIYQSTRSLVSKFENLTPREPFGTIWDHLGPFGTIWNHLEPFGTI